MDKLDEIEYSRLPKQERKLEMLEIAIDEAFLNSVDGGDEDYDGTIRSEDEATQQDSNEAATPIRANITQKGQFSSHDDNHDVTTASTTLSSSSVHARRKVQVSGKVKNDLATLSDALDKLVAYIDSVESKGNAEVKKRKKGLSTCAVKMMEKVDGLISQIQHWAEE